MKICLINLGCKVNQYEIDSLVCSLSKDHEVITALDFADAYIVNTCAVTSEAEKKSRQYIAKITAINPDAKILVCGCASEHNAEQFASKPNVKVVFGTMGKGDIYKYLNDEFVDIKPIDHLSYEDNMFVDNCDRIRGYIKIQDGCNNFCNYCLIPYLRGRSRSRALCSITREAEALSKKVQEIVVTGINMSDYKIDGKLALGEVMASLKDLKSRIRIGSLEVNIITREFLEVLKAMPNFCEHFHLSLQNGSDKVLKEMNRHYTKAEYLEKVKLIREYFPYAGITTDLIVGYPTETDEDFRESLEFVGQVGFSSVHYFAYSRRDGTVAGKLPQVNGSIIKSRVLALKPVVNELKTAFINYNQGRTLEVLVEEKVNNYYVGYSKNYIRCYIPSNDDLINKVVKVTIDNVYLDGAICSIVD